MQQNQEDDEDCIEAVCKERGRPLVREGDGTGKHVQFSNPNGCVEFGKVRVVRLDAGEARGPVFARGHQPETVHDEDFCMQIDAHSIFIKGWDNRMLGEWGSTENEFAVLSTYPTNYISLHKNVNNHWEMPHLCGAEMTGANIRNHQAGAVANLDRPALAPVWAAGLSFSRCHSERWVANDINLKQVFSGEEFSRGARLWTHGYDFYSITRPILGVYYGAEKGGKGSWTHDTAETKASRNWFHRESAREHGWGAPTPSGWGGLGAAACYLLFMLTRALLMTSSHSEGVCGADQDVAEDTGE